MCSPLQRISILFLTILCLFSFVSPVIGETAQPPPVLKWLVAGPFPNPTTSDPQPEGATRAGFAIDYLELRFAGGANELFRRNPIGVLGEGAHEFHAPPPETI